MGRITASLRRTEAHIKAIKLAEGSSARPVVVCVPGAMCPPEVYAEAAQKIECETYSVAWLEGPGPHDITSVAERLVAFAAAFPHVVFVGHSIGVPICAIAAKMRLQAGELVDGLVLSNSGANTAGEGDVDPIINKVRSAWGPDFWAKFFKRCVGTELPEDLAARFLEYPTELDPDEVARAIESLKEVALVPLFGALSKIPTAVVQGRLDSGRTLHHAEELARSIGGATLHVLETGHTSPAEDPDEFASIVKAVVGRASP